MKAMTYRRILEQEATGFSFSDHPASGGSVEWSCPSNIAIVKYWGKKPVQIPLNPSLSLTLHKARTRMQINYRYDPERIDPRFRFTFKGKEVPAFEERIRKLISDLEPLMPFLARTSLTIDSDNTFPHSSGIASSASAMGALSMCLVTLEEKIKGYNDPADKFRKASFLARLGSGSACRSIFPGFALWGAADAWPDSHDEYALPVTGFHPTFRGIKDSILIVESGQKRISSSAGHRLMDTNPYSVIRFQQARSNLDALKQIIMEGDWTGFVSVMEEEALSLHAMMMTGNPGYLLMQPGTISILNRIREFRDETGIPVGFTLDAGANVHVIYPADRDEIVKTWINSELVRYCEESQVIHDQMGTGPSIENP